MHLGTPGRQPGFDLTEAGTQKRLAVWLVDDPMKVPGIAALGPDALDARPDELAAVLKGNTGRIKTVITDQKVIAGIGNAYSDEILHVAKLSPFATAGKLTDAQLAALHDAMISVLTDAVIAFRRPAGRHAQGREAFRAAGARPHRPAVPGLRRHRARGVVRRQVVPVLPDVPDRRQGAGRPADEQAAQVVRQYERVADVSACRYSGSSCGQPTRRPSRRQFGGTGGAVQRIPVQGNLVHHRLVEPVDRRAGLRQIGSGGRRGGRVEFPLPEAGVLDALGRVDLVREDRAYVLQSMPWAAASAPTASSTWLARSASVIGPPLIDL